MCDATHPAAARPGGSAAHAKMQADSQGIKVTGLLQKKSTLHPGPENRPPNLSKDGSLRKSAQAPRCPCLLGRTCAPAIHRGMAHTQGVGLVGRRQTTNMGALEKQSTQHRLQHTSCGADREMGESATPTAATQGSAG